MREQEERSHASRVRGQDLSFWWLDSPMQRTTMAMLMVLDRPPDPARLRRAFERAMAAVPKLSQCVAEAPLGITQPRWTFDSTFDLNYHVRRHALAGAADRAELFREIAAAYETPFDRSRPLWEARIYDGLGPERHSAMFFKLHHAVADGVGGNAIFAAMTDGERDSPESRGRPEREPSIGPWPEQAPLLERLTDAIQDRLRIEVERAAAMARSALAAVEEPEKIFRAFQIVRSLVETASFDSGSPLKTQTGRSRRLTGMSLSFDEVRALKRGLGGSMIDVILTIMARAMGKWHAIHGLKHVEELMTLVPVNLRKPNEWTSNTTTGNEATGILVALPIRIRDPLALYREIAKRMAFKRADPASTASPLLAEVVTAFPRQLLRWLSTALIGNLDYIVTNVPGIPFVRYLAGAEIIAAYPFAPVARTSPLTVALYGYRDRLFVGLDSDESTMPDVEQFQEMISASFEDLRRRVTPLGGASASGARRRAARSGTRSRV